MEKREVALTVEQGSETAVANLDLEEERTEGKAVVAMPQLINVLEDILRTWKKSLVVDFLREVMMKMEKGREFKSG